MFAERFVENQEAGRESNNPLNGTAYRRPLVDAFDIEGIKI
jgi:hypothetical protein